MKANELRIGNWVNNCGQHCFVMEIYKNGKVELGYFENSIGFVRSLDDATIKPIPLTEEWLMKFGFEKTYESKFRVKYDHPCDYIGFDFSKDKEMPIDGFRYYGHYIKIHYLHQLQNLYFALTGKELIINQ